MILLKMKMMTSFNYQKKINKYKIIISNSKRKMLLKKNLIITLMNQIKNDIYKKLKSKN